MLRVIAGKFRSRKLEQPPLTITRATKDRVREAVFSSINQKINGASVLDLFSGSGAYAIEAYSRGASKIILNDQNPIAKSTIKKNLDSLGIHDATLLDLEAMDCLHFLKDKKYTFDIIFLDPPYSDERLHQIIFSIIDNKLLNSKGVIITEQEKVSSLFSKDIFFVKAYNYGRTCIQIGWKQT
jgi:16S rRNA (guanine966-N2)-methyltransferase